MTMLQALRAAAVLGVTCLWVPHLSAQDAGRPVPSPRLAERLFLAELSINHDVDGLYQSESARLLATCTAYDSACFFRHFVPVRTRLAAVHAAPAASSRVVGYVHSVLKVGRGHDSGLSLGLDFEPAAAPGSFEVWIDTVGDWGYGIHISGVRPRGTWLQLFGAPFPASAWIDSEAPMLSAQTSSLQDNLVVLTAVMATSNGRQQRMSGTFFVQRVTNGLVTFRPEVAPDMPCAEDTKPLRRMPASWTAPASAFFDRGGSPRFVVAYPKGC